MHTTTPTTRLVLDPDFTIGEVNRRLFGNFVEHMGRCVYTGIFEPDHPEADEFGFRRDVAELVRELGPTVLRYPGGNFVSNYRWEDGVGDPASRPKRFDLAWGHVESNQVGTDEFLAWCERMGIEPMMAVNLGTRGVAEALELVQYCNADGELELAERRRANGRTAPYDVRLWCLGNEMDGPWQVGHSTPEEYARIAEATAFALKRYDERLELVACGSSNHEMPTFGTWERVTLERCFDVVDYISAHAYYKPIDGDLDSYLASSTSMERFIEDVVATADHVAAVRGSRKRIGVSFDEWNVIDHQRIAANPSPHERAVIEDVFSALDAVVVGSLLIALLRHSDRVTIACQAQLVNVIAPILAEPGGRAWRQTIFHPFALTARFARGEVLRLAGGGPTIETTRYGEVEQVVSTATFDRERGEIAVFLANRDRSNAADVVLDLRGFPDARIVEHLVLHEDDHDAANSAAQPDRVVPKAGDARLDGGRLHVRTDAVSWHCVRLSTTPRSE